MNTQREVDLYEGFILPIDDIKTLQRNGFEYDIDGEMFCGMIEEEEGDARYFEYYPTIHYWNHVVIEPNY